MAIETTDSASPTTQLQSEAITDSTNPTTPNPPTNATTSGPSRGGAKQPSAGGAVTGEEAEGSERHKALIEWVLRPNYQMGNNDRHELGGLSEYVNAGMLAFRATNQMQNVLEEPALSGRKLPKYPSETVGIIVRIRKE